MSNAEDAAPPAGADVKFDKVQTADEVERQSIQKQAPENALKILREFDFMEYSKSSIQFYKENPVKLKKELLSGITVAVMQVPESVAFSFVAGVNPIVGLHSTFFLGFITGAIGGKPAMISGAAGAMAVVIKDLMADDGPLSDFTRDQRFEQLLMCVLLTGLLQMLCGFVQLAKLVRLIPQPAMLGFMNGLAIVIFWAQIGAFKECNDAEVVDIRNDANNQTKDPNFWDCTADELEMMPIDEGRTWLTLLLVAVTMLIMWAMPFYDEKFADKVKISDLVPPSLVAIVLGTVVEWTIIRPSGGQTRTVGETASIDGDFLHRSTVDETRLPRWHFPLVPEDAHWGVMITYAVSLCLVGLIESVMTLQAVDTITETLPSAFRSNQECVAQGLSNALCGVFGAMGGDAMIGQSTINVMNGARGRLSAMTAGVFMLLFIVILSPVIELVPIGTLTGVLFMVVINTFNWTTFHTVGIPYILPRKVPLSDAFVIVEVTVLAVVFNLAVGVIVGVATLSICDAWNRGLDFEISIKDVRASPLADPPQEGSDEKVYAKGNDVRVYALSGSLFFPAIEPFANIFTPSRDPERVAIDFADSAIVDFSAVNAINGVAKRYNDINKQLELWNLCAKDREVLTKAGNLCTGVLIADGVTEPTIDGVVSVVSHALVAPGSAVTEEDL